MVAPTRLERLRKSENQVLVKHTIAEWHICTEHAALALVRGVLRVKLTVMLYPSHSPELVHPQLIVSSISLSSTRPSWCDSFL